MPYWDHKKAIGSAGGLFAVPIYPPCTPYGGLRGVPLRLPELAALGSKMSAPIFSVFEKQLIISVL